MCSDCAGLATKHRGERNFIFIVTGKGRASTHREVASMRLQLVLGLMLFVGGGGSEQTIAVGSAGRI